jgi:hypothetical protein
MATIACAVHERQRSGMSSFIGVGPGVRAGQARPLREPAQQRKELAW